MRYYRKERRGGWWGDRTTEVPNRSHLCDALHVINRNDEETRGRILLSRMSGEMVSVYLLNLIIYISLNPIKLAVYHVKIALGWLSPVRLSYCWRGPDPVPGAVVFPNFSWDVAPCLTCLWWGRPVGHQKETAPHSHLVYTQSLRCPRNQQVCLIFFLAAEVWWSPINVFLW